ncbi:hypothetical protein [Pectobacterium carotovorum]|uniref:Uncharacterized protein n=1 Tax=Pectobacterium carotovorum subsp. carotovorum TaxID=555 RepID=A0AAI9L5N3_PECCC|nr:hypothetical protein [Pectobacterium carotovorum]GKX49594.1 hypothetical protein SOASR016_43460 [Pectobacterium carotovorum subsp. carotovorum]GLV71759.1 hypothetical protein Pcaca03_42030 [Pectobacterium carotovorum subsp. carotovorum]
MSDTTKIPFSFCRIKRAADFLDISIDDLLSLAVSEKITLCVRLDGLRSILWIKGNVTELSDWYLSLSTNESAQALARNISKYTSFSIDRLSYDEENDDTIFHPWFYQSQQADGISSDEKSQSHQGRAFGLWVPQLPVINSVLNYGKSSLLWGSLGLYCTDESTPALCLIPLPLNHDDICNSEEYYEEKYPDIEITENDLWITSEQVRELLKHNGDYSDLPSNALRGVSPTPNLMQEIKKANHIAEHHATNREKLFKSAICLLSKYPDECRGERKEISPEKWKDCIIKHKGEIPPLTINNEDVILRHLRSATNGKV